MKKYRARFDDPETGAFWLTDDDHIHNTCDPKKAFVGTVSQIANLIARMTRCAGGTWTLERKSRAWMPVP